MRTTTTHAALTIGLLIAGLTACSNSSLGPAVLGNAGSPDPGATIPGSPSTATARDALMKADTPYDRAPTVTDQQLSTAVEGEQDFAWALYHQAATASRNLFLSPYSISTALAMAYGAAAGETKSEMATALHFTLPDESFHASMNALELALESRNLPATEFSPALELSVNNAFWVQKGLPPLDSYLDLLARRYDSGVFGLDFRGDPEGSRNVINAAVSEWTNQRVPALLGPGALDDATAVLTNTIYLFAPWETPFEKSLTTDAPFQNYDGTTTQVATMNGDLSARAASGSGYRLLALPYRSGKLEIVIAMPDAGTFDTFERSLDGSRANALLAELQSSQVRVHLPKFSVRTHLSLVGALEALGMRAAFLTGEFPGLGSAQNPIVDVVHEAFVDLSESGTVAAAATAVIFGESAAPTPEVEVRIDHPFVYFIRDVPTNAILFTGRVVTLLP